MNTVFIISILIIILNINLMLMQRTKAAPVDPVRVELVEIDGEWMMFIGIE